MTKEYILKLISSNGNLLQKKEAKYDRGKNMLLSSFFEIKF